MTELKWLKIITGVMGVFAAATGALSGLGGIDGLDAVMTLGVDLPAHSGWVYIDNQYRFFAMLWCGVGLTLLWSLRHLERPDMGPLYRALMVIVFLGGVGRVASVIMLGVPVWHVFASAGLELLLTPVLFFWYPRAVRRA